MARLRTFTRSDGSTVRVTPAEYDRRSRLQRAALERRGLVVLTDKRGRQRGYAPELVAAEVARRERLAERARERAAERRRPRPVEVYAAPVDPCDLDSVRAWITAAIAAVAETRPRVGDTWTIVHAEAAVDDAVLEGEERATSRGAELVGWRHDLIELVIRVARALCPREEAAPMTYRDPPTVAIGSYDPKTGALFVPDAEDDFGDDGAEVELSLTLTRKA